MRWPGTLRCAGLTTPYRALGERRASAAGPATGLTGPGWLASGGVSLFRAGHRFAVAAAWWGSDRLFRMTAARASAWEMIAGR
jgi:hypothetical protein